jgi:hypothetical protein
VSADSERNLALTGRSMGRFASSERPRRLLVGALRAL